jgi:A/G-specific adenine glycosylase
VIGRGLGYDMPTQPHKSDTVYDLMGALTPDNPALARAFNLAILDLGAKVCTPGDPDCKACPLQPGCVYADDQVPE